MLRCCSSPLSNSSEIKRKKKGERKNARFFAAGTVTHSTAVTYGGVEAWLLGPKYVSESGWVDGQRGGK